MNNIIGNSFDKNYKHKSIKNRNVDKGILLQRCFSFQYAGKADVFITFQRGKYQLVITGVNIVEDIFCFAPHVTKRYNFEKLYTAICAFNIVVKILCNNMDWYNKECFDYENIYDEIFFKE